MRDHSAKSESKTTDCQTSQLHHIQRNNVIVFNPRAISTAVRNFVRHHKRRFRPLKRLVLPARSMKRAALESVGPFWGRIPPRLELSTLLMLKHATQNFSNYDTLLLNGSRANYERETLTALEVPPEKIRFVDSRDRFQIASAVFPSLDSNVVAPWKVRGLRELVSSDKPNQHHRLYLSRARAAVRRIANEKEISEALRRHDFEILETEDLS